MVIKKFIQTYIGRYRIAFVALGFWIIALFPGRIGSDALTLVNAMRQGDSSDQWTAVYFRLLWLLTGNGAILWPASLFGLFSLFVSYVYLVESITSNDRLRKILVSILSFSPFIGNWGMTVNHETLDLAGLLIITGILVGKYKNNAKANNGLIAIAGIYSLTSFVGSLAFVVFLCIYLFSRKKLLMGLVASFSIFTLFAGPILNVQPMNSAWKYITFLGDIKCIVQHPDAEISSADWNYLNSIGNKQLWEQPETCLVADFGVGALKTPVVANPERLLKTWINLVMNNPQLALEARLQRTSVLLPPLFFQPQPNMISQDYLRPVGEGTGTDLQQFSELFKTSIDDPKFSNEKLFKLNPFEYLALLITFLFNQRSLFWGYGGLWLMLWLPIAPFLLKIRFKDAILVSAPMLALSFSLFFLMPSPQPRYTGINVILGLTATIFTADIILKRYVQSFRRYLESTKM